jgi:hypothetical protein
MSQALKNAPPADFPPPVALAGDIAAGARRAPEETQMTTPLQIISGTAPSLPPQATLPTVTTPHLTLPPSPFATTTTTRLLPVTLPPFLTTTTTVPTSTSRPPP